MFPHSMNELSRPPTSTKHTISLMLYLLLISQALLLFPLAQSATQHSNITTGATCVSRFYKERSHFDRCRKVPCFVFLSQHPFIVLDKHMTSEKSVVLFPCRERKKFFPGLHGISFDIKDLLPPLENALCVYGGPSCTFEGVMQFVGRHREHQFVAGGFMFAMPHRRTNSTRPSTPLMEDNIVIIGRRDSKTAIAQAYTTILRPFQLPTWMIILAFLAFFALVRVVLAMYFSQPRTLHNVITHVLGEQDQYHLPLPLTQNQETLRLLNKGAVGSLMCAVSGFFVIALLFYEIAVVNFIFAKRTHALQKGLSSLSRKELEQYIITTGGASERIFRTYVDPDKKYRYGKPPWYTCKDRAVCYDRVLNSSHPANFTISYENLARYELKTRKACDLLTVYDTAKPLYAFSAGWYYGPAVPVQTQVKIDRAILELRLHDKIRGVVNRVIDSKMALSCAAVSQNIPPEILGWLLVNIVGVCMIPVLAFLILASRIRQRERRQKLKDEVPESKD